MENKKKQHYVWKRYLRPWAIKDLIWCYREGKIFKPNLEGIAQQRYFYKLMELSQKDLTFLRYFIEKSKNPTLIKLNYSWLEDFINPFRIKKVLESIGFDKQYYDDLIQYAINNTLENIHARIEKGAIGYLDSLLNKNIDFYYTDSGCIDFSLYISMQYMRTTKNKQDIISVLQNEEYVNIENCIHPLSIIAATNVGWSLYSRRQHSRMVLLQNETSTEFITGDQPVINTFANSSDEPLQEHEFELYYPVSSRLAILISEKDELQKSKVNHLSERDVDQYNKMIIQEAHNQIYASSKEMFLKYEDELNKKNSIYNKEELPN